MWLGKWKDRADEPCGFKWPKEPIILCHFVLQPSKC